MRIVDSFSQKEAALIVKVLKRCKDIEARRLASRIDIAMKADSASLEIQAEDEDEHPSDRAARLSEEEHRKDQNARYALASNQVNQDFGFKTVLPVDCLTPNTDHARKNWETCKIVNLTENIREYGLLRPVGVIIRLGRIVIMDGHLRFRAIKSLKRPTIAVQFIEISA